MDRYVYRAKANDNWVYGAYFKFLPYTPNPLGKTPREDEYKHLIITHGFSDWNLPRDMKVYEINPRTLCQCTGIKGSNKLDIFENDIVEYRDQQYAVKWVRDKFMLKKRGEDVFTNFPVDTSEIKVIGDLFSSIYHF